MDIVNRLETLEQAALEDAEKKKHQSQKVEYHFDKLAMYFDKDYFVKDIRIKMPTIGDILKFGESRFYNTFSPFFTNSTSIRVQLWDMEPRVDWTKVKDIQVFNMLHLNLLDEEVVHSVFPDITFSDFQLMGLKDDPEKLVLYSSSQQIILTEPEYMEIATYIRTVLNRFPKVEKAKGKTTKQWMIQEDRMKMLNSSKENDEENSSYLLSLVSSCLNHPGFKYKLEDLENMGIYRFMDSVKRIQKYEHSTAVLKGMYSGFVDGSKINPEQYNFMGDV